MGEMIYLILSELEVFCTAPKHVPGKRTGLNLYLMCYKCLIFVVYLYFFKFIVD